MITPKEFADKYFPDFKLKGDEIVPKYCPYCKGGENGKDKETFALNEVSRTFNCKRGNCGKSGTFYKLLSDFSEINGKDNYIKPKVKAKMPSTKIEQYFKNRCISKQTYTNMKIGEKNNTIVFPYFEKGELVLIKYRTLDKKQWREKGGKPVFWGMDNCDPKFPLIIVEGELDKLSLDEVGIKNSVSVPSGSEDLTCIDLCWNWLEKFKSIIIWADNDEAGKKMQYKLIKRLGEWRCSIVYTGFKDANECLQGDGKDKVLELVNNAREVKIRELLRLADVETFDIKNAEKIKIGLSGIDNEIGGAMPGEISIWTGENGSGKSTILGQIMIESIEQNYQICAYSGELPAALFRYWIELQMAGLNNIEIDSFKSPPSYYIRKHIKAKLRDWYMNKFFLYDSMQASTTEDILRVFEYAARRYGCKIFYVDNLMTTMYEGIDRDYYRKQSEFVGRLKDFALSFRSHVHIVAHPRKYIGELKKQDIGGSIDITNRADNVFRVVRMKKEENFDTKVSILKNRFRGKQEIDIHLMFDIVSKRFYLFSERNNKKYSWEYEEELL